VLPHLSIHRRRDEQRRQSCECDLANRIAREADCEFRDNICGRRRDEEEISTRLAALGAPLDRVGFHPRWRLDSSGADLFWYPWNVALPAPRRGVVVATIQDVAPLVLPDPRRRKLLKNLRWRRRYRLTARRATLLIAISQFTRDETHRVLGFPTSRIRVTPLAAEI